jgi:hypothetical protein
MEKEQRCKRRRFSDEYKAETVRLVVLFKFDLVEDACNPVFLPRPYRHTATAHVCIPAFLTLDGVTNDQVIAH